ncbi:hypothetical protein 2 [Beihai picorna-like virus 51]|uniref:hypothetical protein 2 n=1 Tax=Beihai picorna-like virus 51 TaxID=1922596 RepID=UPI00090B6447|nr:hypothetical protein 2 [Beihai picorna-like virus 51]APG78012.1 hypothetical protein 2 [Beihai picorna-like virus 51]
MNTPHKIFGSGMAEDATISTQNMSILDNSPGQKDTRGTHMDETRNDGFMSDTTLDNFFSRPILIFQNEWVVGGTMFHRFNPWKLFWENPRNAEKIRNYYLLKCTMHVKLLINGNAFYYGRAIMAYEPLAALDNITPTSYRSFIPADLVRMSQRMHFYINPTESQGGSLSLPFFYPKNAFRVPANDWDEMGDIVITSMNTLQHANGGTDPLTISVLAWAENVSFSIPTAGILNEAEMADEHEQNVISRPASNVARYARSLANIPWIGPFAKATEIGASAVAAIAKIFGYSSPTNLDYEMMVPNPRPSLAVVDAKYATNKLTVDSKQELTIDPVTTGINATDELPIASIAGRESYLTFFNWSMNAAPQTRLIALRVDPFLTIESDGEYHFTAPAAAVLPFKYWRGTMRFRFQVVSSAYHKGRLRVVYDPLTLVPNAEFNTHYTTVHDISTDKDFTIDVGWAQNEPYREKLDLTDVRFTRLAGSTLNTIPRGNGMIGVYVLNELTVPGTVVANVQVNVFISMLDDFEVAEPTDDISLFRFRPPVPVGTPEMADMAVMEDADCCETPISDPPTIDTMADSMIESANITKLFFGEVIGSVRQLLKRTCLAEIVNVDDSGSPNRVLITRNAFPLFGGIMSPLVPLTTDSMVYWYDNGNGDKIVPVATTYLNYFGMMFLGWRGSIRWTFDTSTLNVMSNVVGGSMFNSITMCISRDDRASNINSYDPVHPAGPESVGAVTLLNVEDGLSQNGAYLGNTNVNPIMSAEVPFYSNERFLVTHQTPRFDEATVAPSFRLNFVLPGLASEDDYSFLRMYCSAGEDFNLFFFNGLPPMFYLASLPLDL